MVLDGKTPIDTGSTKVGSLIGDHTKTSIGTLFNTGAYVGAMAVIAATGKPLPKFIPSFAWFLEGVVTKGFGKKTLYDTAQFAMGRRKCQWTPADEAMWDTVFELTAPARHEAVKRGRRAGREERRGGEWLGIGAKIVAFRSAKAPPLSRSERQLYTTTS